MIVENDDKVSDKRGAILDAALKLIAERGFHNTPVSMITDVSGVSAGIIYHYFDSKDDLIRELYKEVNLEAARRIVASMARPHRWLYQHFGGRFVNRKKDSTVLMLTTTGRKSGEQRSVLLLHAIDGDNFIVVGSNWGMDKPPAWLLNLESKPEATVTIAPNDYPVLAEFPQGDEGERYWDRLVEVVAQLPDVAKNANRKLPVVKLVRI